MPVEPGHASPMQIEALDRGRELAHMGIRRSGGPKHKNRNGSLAERVFRDAIAAIEENGSAIAYFRDVAEREPIHYLKFLQHLLGKYLPSESQTIEGERIYRSREEVREELMRRGIPIPSSLVDEDAVALERERLIARTQTLEARVGQAEAERDAMFRSFGTSNRN